MADDVTVTITLLPSLSFYHPSTKHLSTPFISVTLTPATLSTPSSENWSLDVSCPDPSYQITSISLTEMAALQHFPIISCFSSSTSQWFNFQLIVIQYRGYICHCVTLWHVSAAAHLSAFTKHWQFRCVGAVRGSPWTRSNTGCWRWVLLARDGVGHSATTTADWLLTCTCAW